MNSQFKQFLQKPVVGSVLTVAAGISFFFNLMCLPLVGRAGSSVPDVDKNKLAFLGVLGLTFALAALATWAKMLRRSGDKSPLPIWSLGLCAVCTVLFVLLMAGLLAV
jgi:tellurite resistance protein TehA-like permease